MNNVQFYKIMLNNVGLIKKKLFCLENCLISEIMKSSYVKTINI